MLLQQQVALITGSSSGIGRAAAELFAEQGASVVLLDREAEQGREVAERIVRQGGQALFYQVDMRDRDGIRQAVRETISAHQKIDVLFSNAGINPHIGPIEATTDEQWDDLIDINLRSCFDVIRAVVPHMKEQGSGAVVATSSISGRVWAAGHSTPYGVTKTGIEAIIKSVAAQYGPYGIRANSILPGFIDTPLNWVKDEEVRGRILQRIPLRRAGSPEDVAKVALFLASDLSSYVNGESIIVDGGFTI